MKDIYAVLTNGDVLKILARVLKLQEQQSLESNLEIPSTPNERLDFNRNIAFWTPFILISLNLKTELASSGVV